MAIPVALLAAAPGVGAGEVTLFVSSPTPSATWNRGWGGTFTTTWFHAVALEAEYASQPVADPDPASDDAMKSFTGSALVAPPIGPVTPFGGIGIGFFRQTLGERTDSGILRAFVVGARLRLFKLVVLRAEYRDFRLSGDPLFVAEKRYAVGAGVAF